MNNIVAWFLGIIIVGSNPSFAQMDEIAQSHIEANVPPKKSFDSILVRDLKAYFKQKLPDTLSVSYQLLRDGPTQTGISYPKFYAWVEVKGRGKKVLDVGAVRLAAVEKKQFEVTDFIAAKQITEDQKLIERIFPAALCDGIRERAKQNVR